MESSKIQAFIDKLAEKTARNEYDWKRLSDNFHYLNQINPELINNLNTPQSFCVDTQKQRIFLLNFFHSHSIMISDLGSDDSYTMSIQPSSYYRLESLIANSHQVRDKMIDDFLDE